MSSRHVHFTGEDKHVHTPSPSWSDASLPSSTGPITPPPRGYELPLAGTYRAQPALSSLTEESLLEYDLTLEPGTVSLPLTKAKANMKDVLSQSAALPPVTLLEFGHPKLEPLTMYIHPFNPKSGNPLTVAEVIAGLYGNFRQQITKEEFAALSPARRERISQAFQQRVCRAGKKDSPERKAEFKKGLKRIDLLEGDDIFKGFETVADKPGNYWKLVTGRRTGA